MIEQLHDFLTTPTRNKIMVSYMMESKSQSEAFNSLKTVSLSTIEKTTSILFYIKALKKEESRENKQIYSVNWESWAQDAFNILDIKDEQFLKDFVSIISRKDIISLMFYLNHPDFIKFSFEQSEVLRSLLENESNIPKDILLKFLIKKSQGFGDYPLYFLLPGTLPNFSKLFEDKTLLGEEKYKTINELFENIYENNKDLGICKIQDISKEVVDKREYIKNKVKEIFKSKIEKEVENEEDDE
jgi:hypothetical protein